jgi:hypothetical protein
MGIEIGGVRFNNKEFEVREVVFVNIGKLRVPCALHTTEDSALALTIY